MPGASATADRLSAMGFDPVIRPLLEVRSIAGAMANAPSPAGVACLAITSPNGVDAIKGGISLFAHLPVFAVGDTTALCAREAGFTDVQSASGDIKALARLITAKAPMGTVYAPGAAIPAGDLPALLPDRSVIRHPVYETVETEAAIPENVLIALVHSPRAGEILSRLLEKNPYPLRAIAISDAAAAPLRSCLNTEIIIADHPDEEAMLRALGNSQTAV